MYYPRINNYKKSMRLFAMSNEQLDMSLVINN